MQTPPRKTSKQEHYLLPPDNPPFVIICEPGSIDNFDALAKPDNVRALPPPASMTGMLGLALAGVALVVSVDEATKTGAVTANDDNSLADPSSDVLDVLTTRTAQCVDNVDEIGRNVAKHVDVTGRSSEGHDHGGVLDETRGLGAERVPEMIVGAAGGKSGGVGCLGMGFYRGESFGAALAWSPGWVGDGIVGRAEGWGTVG